MDNTKYDRLIKEYDLHSQKILKATAIDITESAKEKADRIRKNEKAYIDWFEYYFPHYAKVKSAPYHKELADRIIKDRKIKLLAEIFRSGGKSVHIDLGIPLYLMVTGQLHFMLLVGETELKAKKLLGDIQNELEFNTRFINDYGRKLSKGNWADGNFYTSDGVRFMSIGFGQSPRGLREGSQRPDYIAVDDIDTKKHVNNSTMMSDGVDYVFEEVMGCFDSEDNSIERFVYANNNFHKNSITNRLKNEFTKNIKEDKDNGFKTEYSILTVCAVVDLKDFQPTWAAKTTAAYWKRKYTKRPRSFMREYMHMHVQDGKVFLAEHIQYREMLKLGDYDALAVYGDLSYKDKGDYKGLGLLGKKGRQFHIIAVFLRQTSRREAAAWLYDLYEDLKLHKYNITYKIEGLFAMDEFVGEFDLEGDERGYHIPVIADKRGKANKFDRIESTQGYFIRRWVFFNEAERNNSDQVELIDQYLAFEKGSQAHDDGPDFVHGAMDDLTRKTHADSFDPRIETNTHNNSQSY